MYDEKPVLLLLFFPNERVIERKSHEHLEFYVCQLSPSDFCFTYFVFYGSFVVHRN